MKKRFLLVVATVVKRAPPLCAHMHIKVGATNRNGGKMGELTAYLRLRGLRPLPGGGDSSQVL